MGEWQIPSAAAAWSPPHSRSVLPADFSVGSDWQQPGGTQCPYFTPERSTGRWRRNQPGLGGTIISPSSLLSCTPSIRPLIHWPPKDPLGSKWPLCREETAFSHLSPDKGETWTLREVGGSWAHIWMPKALEHPKHRSRDGVKGLSHQPRSPWLGWLGNAIGSQTSPSPPRLAAPVQIPTAPRLFLILEFGVEISCPVKWKQNGIPAS